MSTWAAVIAAGIGSYLLRGVFILALAERQFPPLVLRTLEYVSPAVMGALIVSMLTTTGGTVTLGAAELAGLSAAAIVVQRTRNHALALLAAMALYWSVGFMHL